MYRGKTVAVVVPAYNEETQIHKVITSMPDFIDKVVIVDDCSKDQTSRVVSEYAAKDPRVVLVRHEVNQGVGGAIGTGYSWARDNGIDCAVVMAGDGQMDPRELPGLLDPVVDDEADYTKGNRLLYPGAYKVVPRVRFIGNVGLTFLTKAASGYWHIFDSQVGYTAVNRDVLETIDWDKMYKRYGMPNDLLVRLNVENFRVQDVPMAPVYNVGEQSKLKVRKVMARIGWLLVKCFCWRMREKYVFRNFHPLVLFYMAGFTLLLISLPLMLRVLYYLATEFYIPPVNFLAALFSFSTGLTSLFFAMLFDMQENKELMIPAKRRRRRVTA